MSRTLLIVLGASAAILAACNEDTTPPPRMVAANTFAPNGYAWNGANGWARPVSFAPPRPAVATTPTSGSIHIDEKILRACGDLPIAHFAFDSAAVQPEAAYALDALARCFTTGALAGRSMRLTGHTDQRGELEYNLALGQRRAGSVASYLEGRGMTRAQLSTSSHGELDATGVDEAGWARDRKVDVALAE